MTNWELVHDSSLNRPLEIDNTSSSYYIYERRNIHQEEIPSFEGNDKNETTTQWAYEERKYTKEEYENLNSATTQLIMQNISDLAVDLAILKEVTSNV